MGERNPNNLIQTTCCGYWFLGIVQIRSWAECPCSKFSDLVSCTVLPLKLLNAKLPEMVAGNIQIMPECEHFSLGRCSLVT